ncbi:MAG: hypothetical protein ACLFR7_04600 [Opitutales bacterium]
MLRVRPFLLSLLLLGLAHETFAQRPVFRRQQPDEKRSNVTFSTRILFGVDMELSRLGEVGFPTFNTVDEETGQTIYRYNDGYVAVEEGATGTSNVQFLWANANRVPREVAVQERGGLSNPSDPYEPVATEFTLSRFRSESMGATATADSEANYGWEVGYQYQWGKSSDRIRFGLMGGLAFNNLDFTYSGNATGALFQELETFRFETFLVRPKPDASGQVESVYQGGDGGAEIIVGGIGDNTEEVRVIVRTASGETIESTTDVAVAADFDGVLAMLRLGPTMSWRAFDNLQLELSAGVIGSYLSSVITTSQTYSLPLDPGLPSNIASRGQAEVDDFLYGFYAEGLLRYQFTSRVGFYGSMMYVKMQDLEDSVVGSVEYDLSLQSPLIGAAGLRVTF